MIYTNIVEGTFLERPNRFIAHVLIDGQIEIAHVKNTGRCRELLIKGVKVFLKYEDNPSRKTKYSLIAVDKKGLLINMDSQVPNKVVFDALVENKIEGIQAENIKRESTYGNSRFDIYFEEQNRKSYMEVKGVTLEEDGIARFPDAPTQRGLKHINELIRAKEEGYNSYVLFLIQMDHIKEFMPNYGTDREFAEGVKNAHNKGVKILCYNSIVEKDKIVINKAVKINLDF